MSNLRAIVAMDAKRGGEGEKDLTERVRKCMAASVNHWMATDEQDQFAGAVAGAIALSDGDEREALEAAVAALNSISAAIGGVPVNFEAMTEKRESLKERGIQTIPLTKIWNEVKDRA